MKPDRRSGLLRQADARTYKPCVASGTENVSPPADDYQPCASSQFVNFPFLSHAGAEDPYVPLVVLAASPNPLPKQIMATDRIQSACNESVKKELVLDFT